MWRSALYVHVGVLVACAESSSCGLVGNAVSPLAVKLLPCVL